MSDIQSQGGKARAKKLSKSKRHEIAKRAASSRWNKDLPEVSYDGVLSLAGTELPCAVLTDNTRVLTEADFMREMNMYRSGALSVRRAEDDSGDRVPLYLAFKNLRPYIERHLGGLNKDLILRYRTTKGGVAHGIRADTIPAICEAWMDARKDGVLGSSQEKVAEKAEILLRGLARVGIIALIDEATGYQSERNHEALAKILEAFVAKELRPWVKTFPATFYENLCRLRNLEYPPTSQKLPQYFGHLTNEIVYKRLAPGVLDELKNHTPRDGQGKHVHHLHRRLSDNVGHPKLKELLAAVVALMKVSKDYDSFINLLDIAQPRFNSQQLLPFATH